MTSAANTATNTAVVTKGARPIFYTRKDHKGAAVTLYLGTKTADRAPAIEGTIGGVRVAGFLQKGTLRGFVSFVDSAKGKGENGHYTQVATGSVVVLPTGVPALVIKAEGAEPNWVEVSLDATQDLLVAAGLDLDKLAAKKAEMALAKAAKASEAVPA